MIKRLAKGSISKDQNVKVRPQTRCTTVGGEDLIKPQLHRNSDAIIIHSRTHDFMNNRSTKKKTKNVVKLFENKNPDFEVIK